MRTAECAAQDNLIQREIESNQNKKRERDRLRPDNNVRIERID